MYRIAIVGAGLSGRLVVLNLLRHAPPHAAVTISTFERGDERYMGPAYSDEAPYLLLNVPACRMGALSDDPEHFLKWARREGVHAGQWDFLPRRLYREYVLHLISELQTERTDGPLAEHVHGEVTDIEAEGDRARLHVDDAGPFVADKVVLALGNFPPRHPPARNASALRSERYVWNPWNSRALDSLSRRDTVALIGTGQTMVDVVVALYQRGHEGRIVAISRRGLLPLAHQSFESYPSFFEEMRDLRRLLTLFRVVRRHLERAGSLGIDIRAVIDSLRPHTQTIWFHLSEGEKRRFLRHVFRHWEIIRSRIPPQSEAIVEAMRAAGQLHILRGRISDVADSGAGMEVQYIARGQAAPESVTASLVINCIGPESDYRRIEHPLVRNLMRRGLIRPGPAQLGIDALPNGAIMDRDGVVADVLYTIGSTMKGVLWEVLAVPDIRVQAEQLAHLLVGNDRDKIGPDLE